MTEYRFVTFNQPIGPIVPPVGGVATLTIDFLESIPALAEQMEGWEVVGFHVVPASESMLLMLLLKMDVTVPDNPAGVAGELDQQPGT
jgi:hypothetical protein